MKIDINNNINIYKSMYNSNKSNKNQDEKLLTNSFSFKGSEAILANQLANMSFPTKISVVFPEKNYIDIYTSRPQTNIYGEKMPRGNFINIPQVKNDKDVLKNVLKKFKDLDVLKLTFKNQDDSFSEIILTSTPSQKFHFLMNSPNSKKIESTQIYLTASTKKQDFIPILEKILTKNSNSELSDFSLIGTEKAIFKQNTEEN